MLSSEENRYNDIINQQWPKESSRPKMNLDNRAKIFLPFAALTGFEAEIEKRRKGYEEKMNNDKGKIQFED